MRIVKYDNIKCLCIFLIVLGHMIEAVDCGIIGEWIYMIIYSFHIPVFVFIMGYFTKFDKKEIIRIIILYIIFQTIYLFAFNAKHLLTGEYFIFDYTTPFWLAWYLMLMIIYKTITHLIKKLCEFEKIVLFVIAICIGLCTCYIHFLNYRFSLMRATTFFPYFICGIIYSEKSCNNKLHDNAKRLTLVLVIFFCVFICYQKIIDKNILYGITGSPLQKAIVYIIGFTWIAFFENWMPNKEITSTVLKIGQNTLPIYLMHGLVIKIIFTFWQPSFKLLNILICILISICLCVELGKPKYTKLLSLKWLIK